MSTYAELSNNLDQLSLSKIKEILPVYLDSNPTKDKSLVDILTELTSSEIEFRDGRAKKINVMVSSFPCHKTLKEFDFIYQPTINNNKVMDLATLRFMEEKSNIIFMGSPGTGKHIWLLL